MKCDIVNVPNKGICILISDIDPKDFIKGILNNDGSILKFSGGVFTDLYIISQYIIERKKIAAIKEIRSQTGWGLRESKMYIEKYLPLNTHIEFIDYDEAARKFVSDHAPKEDFIKNDDFEL